MEDKIKELLKSGITENVQLAMNICKSEYPMLWAALAGYTSSENLTEEMLSHLSRGRQINIGSKVKYKGMEGCPTMVVTNITFPPWKSLGTGRGYITKLNCKYYNKSSQGFCSIEDRIECFEIV